MDTVAENKTFNEEALVEMAHTMGLTLRTRARRRLTHSPAAWPMASPPMRKSWPPKTEALNWYTMKKTKNRS